MICLFFSKQNLNEKCHRKLGSTPKRKCTGSISLPRILFAISCLCAFWCGCVCQETAFGTHNNQTTSKRTSKYVGLLRPLAHADEPLGLDMESPQIPQHVPKRNLGATNARPKASRDSIFLHLIRPMFWSPPGQATQTRNRSQREGPIGRDSDGCKARNVGLDVVNSDAGNAPEWY